MRGAYLVETPRFFQCFVASAEAGAGGGWALTSSGPGLRPGDGYLRLATAAASIALGAPASR